MSTTVQTDFLQAVRNRRSLYALSKQIPVSEQRIQDIVMEAVQYTPSSFNSQSARVIVLFGKHHEKLWDITRDILKTIVPEDQFESTAQRMDMFRGAYGTVLFFEDVEDINALQTAYPTYQDRFPVWAQHSNGMLQFVVWTALEAEGVGANLQHYNPLIDERVRAEWNVPQSWELIAQMPFGTPTSDAGDKDFKPLDQRVKVMK